MSELNRIFFIYLGRQFPSCPRTFYLGVSFEIKIICKENVIVENMGNLIAKGQNLLLL